MILEACILMPTFGSIRSNMLMLVPKCLMKPIAQFGCNQTIYATDLAGSMLSASTNNISATNVGDGNLHKCHAE